VDSKSEGERDFSPVPQEKEKENCTKGGRELEK